MDQQKLDPEVAAFVRERKLRWLNWGGPLIFVALLFGGGMLYATLTAKHLKPGDPCEHNSDCGVKSLCLVAAEGSFCAPSCQKPTDCPPGQSCRIAELIRESGQTAAEWMLVCQKN